MSDWIDKGRSDLLDLARPSGAWGYRIDRGPSVEATALACLGLWSCRCRPPLAAEPSAILHGADWLLAMQRSDGSLGVSQAISDPGWPTPLAMLLWNTLRIHEPARRRAAAWLLDQQGKPVATDTAQSRSIVGHNPELVGWPWIAGTHSWVEPTALAVLALAREGFPDHPRVAQGIRVLLDRALAHGGWNYGNTSVFGRELRPQPGPTGQALMALAALPGKASYRAVGPAVAFLRRILPQVRAPISLSWGVLGLRAWNECPDEAGTWLSESHACQAGSRDLAAGLGLLLLAAGDHDFLRRDMES